MIKFDQDKKYPYIWNQRVKIYKNHYRKNFAESESILMVQRIMLFRKNSLCERYFRHLNFMLRFNNEQLNLLQII
ncbi:hypothetical protein BpHYR1_017267 [Brachionus plicatilis]|uniref:Uncharacterized protein n=1 Tax=Brachionus plicatilis TaxID=10195 RepID=A0A3M7PEJ6_BRAPC|nr:hypothetical protein BpHYR1_017267 [Brachionus plicatilis]